MRKEEWRAARIAEEGSNEKERRRLRDKDAR